MTASLTRAAGALAAIFVAGAGSASAARVEAPPGAGLQALLDAARDGDIVVLKKGAHPGPLVVRTPVTLEGEEGARVEGPGRGSVVIVEAPGATVRNLFIAGSGKDLDTMDAGIFLARTARNARVENNRLEGNLYGVYVHGAEGAVVRDNDIAGIREGRMNEAGNGVSVWNAPGAQVVDNRISYGRDGIFSITSKRNLFARNRFENVRFAVHYMYTNDSEISDNVSVGNSVGYAMMYSNNLIMRGNVSDHDRDHAFLFNYANGSTIAGNIAVGGPQPAERWLNRGVRASMEHGVAVGREAPAPGDARVGPEKCVFIYNANRNRFEGNWFEGCEIGVHFTAGSEGNIFSGNAFVANRNQVKYVGTRYLDWAKGGRGNYWSDNPAFDLNGDGVADVAYRPNDLIDRVLWSTPAAKLIATSPAVQIVRWAQSQFPGLSPGGVVDTRPLMKPPARPDLSGARQEQRQQSRQESRHE